MNATAPHPIDLTRFFHPIHAAKALKKKPVRVLLGGRAYVLFRDGQGRPAVLDNTCPHRRAPLSEGRVRPDGRLACAYHGWNFDAEGHGRSPTQPTLAGCDVRSYQVVERYGYLWMSARETPESALPFLHWRAWEDKEQFRYSGAFTTLFEAPLAVCLDNFSEDEHFPYIHRFFGWGEDNAPKIDHHIEVVGDEMHVHYAGAQRRDFRLPFLGVKPKDRLTNDWVTRFDPPSATFTFHWYDPDTNVVRPLVTRAPIFFVPETETTTRFHTFLFLRMGNRFLRSIRPVVRRITLGIAKKEIGNDAEFIPHVAHTGESLAGMRLGKYDKGVIQARKMLDRIYLGKTPRPTDAGMRASGWDGFRELVVTKKSAAATDVVSIELAAKDGHSLPTFLPGQHLTFRFQVGGKPIVRCYSLSDRPHPGHYAITVKRLSTPAGRGASSGYLFDDVAVGQTLMARAPSGSFHLDPEGDGPIALVAGGIGVTPLLSMVRAIAARGVARDTWLFYGARHADQLVAADELRQLAAERPWFHVTFCVSDQNGNGQAPPVVRGHVDLELLRGTLPSNDRDFYLCGPAPMMQSIVDALGSWGVPDARIHLEAFGPATVRRARGDAPAADPVDVTFLRAGRICRWDVASGSLLELAEKNGITIDHGCRAGSCGTCQTAVGAGQVGYLGIPGEPPAPGTCLPCIAVPRGALELDA